MIRQQNFKKNPHTARFLQTFHSGISSTGVNYRQEMGVDTEERAATQFVSGGQAPERRTALNANNTEIFIRGWRILTGPGLITEKQAKWVVDIAETKANVTDAMVASLAERLTQGFPKQAASEFITRYKDWPAKEFSAAKAEAIAPGASDEEIRAAFGPGENKTAPVRDAQGVRAGRYAIREDGVVKFFRVTEGKGRWAGRTFVEAQASDDHYAIRNPQRREEILKAIAEAPEAAQTLYGQELGNCYRCGRTLTDETSRSLGIGPDCRSKL